MKPTEDHRLYLPRGEKWSLRVMTSYDREYCHAKFPDDPHYHLLVGGELHLDDGEKKYCLECALRLGLLTQDRIFWQKGRAADVEPIEPGSDPSWE